jgi:SAM-dependent methyltransferase
VKKFRAPAPLVELASAPYRHIDRVAYYPARSKLSIDPAFTAILELGLLRQRARIVDLGCGQGLLQSWLNAARTLHADGRLPPDWPEPPRPVALLGLDLAAREIERARRALGGDYHVGDICSADLGSPDAVVLLDVLHYIPPEPQLTVLRRVRAALPAGGLLLTRVGDADGSLPFRFSTWVDKVVMAARGRGFGPLYCRPLREWLQVLAGCGFRTDTVAMRAGTPFANVMLLAHAQ